MRTPLIAATLVITSFSAIAGPQATDLRTALGIGTAPTGLSVNTVPGAANISPVSQAVLAPFGKAAVAHLAPARFAAGKAAVDPGRKVFGGYLVPCRGSGQGSLLTTLHAQLGKPQFVRIERRWDADRNLAQAELHEYWSDGGTVALGYSGTWPKREGDSRPGEYFGGVDNAQTFGGSPPGPDTFAESMRMDIGMWARAVQTGKAPAVSGCEFTDSAPRAIADGGPTLVWGLARKSGTPFLRITRHNGASLTPVLGQPWEGEDIQNESVTLPELGGATGLASVIRHAKAGTVMDVNLRSAGEAQSGVSRAEIERLRDAMLRAYGAPAEETIFEGQYPKRKFTGVTLRWDQVRLNYRYETRNGEDRGNWTIGLLKSSRP